MNIADNFQALSGISNKLLVAWQQIIPYNPGS